MTPDTEAEADVERWLATHHLSYTRPSRSRHRTPDFDVDDNPLSVLIEVKTRRDDDTWRPPSVGETQSGHRDLFHQNKIFAMVADAREQLRAHDPLHERLWVVWLSAEERRWGGGALENLRGTLLGIRWVVLRDLEPPRRGTCYYARRGTFERLSDIDAAVIVCNDESQLLVNEFSQRHSLLVQTGLAKSFGTALFVPGQREGLPGEFILDGGRRDLRDMDVYERLEAKYGHTRLAFMGAYQFVGIGGVPHAAGDAAFDIEDDAQ